MVTLNDINTGFFLAQRLEADTFPVLDLRLCSVRLMNDSRYPWVILVPRVAGVGEIFDLDRAEQNFLMQEMTIVSKAMATVCNAHKINVGALGNIVRQLHVHVLARFEGDPAWPGPVWGIGEAVPYSDDGQAFLSLLRPEIMEEMKRK